MFKFIKSKKTYLISFGLALAVFAGLQYQARGVFADPDGFYHAKVSQLLVHGNLTDQYIWMPFTTWANGFADQHYLYHLLLSPFNQVDSLPVSIVIFGIIFFIALLVLFYKFKVSGVIWWAALILFGSVDFIFRLNLVKANALSLVLMFLVLILLLQWQQNRSKINLLLMSAASFIFVWTYGGFVFLPVLVGGYVLAIYITQKKFDLWPLLIIILGIGLGMLFHPHSGHLIESLGNQLFQTGLRAGSEVPAGNEWLQYNLFWFVKSNLIVLIVWLFSIGIIIHKLIRSKLSWQEIWLQILAIFFFFLAMQHRRFIEYFVPFAVLASAIVFEPFFSKIEWQEVKNTIKKYWQFRFVLLFVTITITLTFGWNFNQVASYVKQGTSSHQYEHAAQAIAEQSNPGDMVLNTQWDQFPQLWYWNSKNYYMAGMDPTFMYLQDPVRYWQWRKIADDNTDDWKDATATHLMIKESLATKFIFIETDRNSNIIEFLDQYPQFFEPFFSEDNIAVYKVL